MTTKRERTTMQCVICHHEGAEVILRPDDSGHPVAACWDARRCATRVAMAVARAEAQADRYCPICAARTTLPLESDPERPGREIHRCAERTLAAIDRALASDGPVTRTPSEAERLHCGFMLLFACEYDD
jgi:hypothetical protein